MSHHLSIRISDAERDFLHQQAVEKGLTRTAAARHLLLQNIAIESIKNTVKSVLETELIEVHARLEIIDQQVAALADLATRDDLKKAVNFLSERIKK